MDWDRLGWTGCVGLLGGRTGLAQAHVKEVPILKYHPLLLNREYWECLFYWVLTQQHPKPSEKLELPVKLFHKIFLLPLLNLDFA